MACPYSEPINPVNAPLPISLKPVLILSFHLCLGLPSSLLLSGFPTKFTHIFIFLKQAPFSVKGHFLTENITGCSFLLFSTDQPSSYPTALRISWSTWKN